MGTWEAVLFVWTSALALTSALPIEEESVDIDLLMPDNRPQKPDTYSCVAMQVPEKKLSITGFEPHAEQGVAHHVLIYGCEEPGQQQGIWDCGEMNAGSGKPVCAQGSQIIYAWAKNADPLVLPDDVGFQVGQSTAVKWLVLQVHYMDVSSFLPPQNGVDRSGVTLQTTTKSLPRRAGTYLMLTGGELAPHSTVYLEAACSYDDNVVMHPFAFRTHTHEHGKVVAGYVYHDGAFTEIGRKNPQLPQMFYPVENDVTVQPGDRMFARCTMVNDEDRVVKIGMTHEDEMCNFYMMYYVDGSQLPNTTTCFKDGDFHWSQFSESSGPPDTASTVPGTKEVISESHSETKSSYNSDSLNEDEMEAALQNYLKEVKEVENRQREYEEFLERALEQEQQEALDWEEPLQDVFQRVMRADDEYPYDWTELEKMHEYYANL